MGKIHQLKKNINGTLVDIYPITTPEAVVDSGGVDVSTKLEAKQDKADESLLTTSKQVVGAINELNAGKVDKVSGKGLSSNDYTTEEKTKLAGLENYDDSDVLKRTSQTLTDAEKAQVRENIGIGSTEKIICGRHLFPSEIITTMVGSWNAQGVYDAASRASILARITPGHKALIYESMIVTICDGIDENNNLINPVRLSEQSGRRELSPSDDNKIIAMTYGDGYGAQYFIDYGRFVSFEDEMYEDEYNEYLSRLDKIYEDWYARMASSSSRVYYKTPLMWRLEKEGVWNEGNREGGIESPIIHSIDYYRRIRFGGYMNHCNLGLRKFDSEFFPLSAITDLHNAFSFCKYLGSADLTYWDVSAVTNMSNMFYKCDKLESLVGNKTYEEVVADSIKALNGTSINLYLGSSSLLNRASARALINGLATLPSGTSRTLTLHAKTKALLSADDIAIATLKGWTIA